MAQTPIGEFPPGGESIASAFPIFRDDSFFNVSDAALSSLVDRPRLGEFKREMLTWRTPHLGFVKMYINPQSLIINDKKDITSTRTKGGFVMQYAGEDLTDIKITGITGSGGIEGINILRSVYRAEQEAFNHVAVALEERLSAAQVEAFASNATDDITGLLGFQITPDSLQLGDDFLKVFGQPQPTLASLAAGIEMFFQGIVYRGYFENFSVTEQASEPGHFEYTIGFKAYARQGVRRNFMPWHRQPYNPADINANPLSFSGRAGGRERSIELSIEEAARRNLNQPIPSGTDEQQLFKKPAEGGPKRYTAPGIDQNGRALSTTGTNVSVSAI